MSRRRTPRQNTNENSGFKPTKLVPRSDGQRFYLETIKQNDITMCSGPAGAGKTFIACAMAARALKDGEVSRIVLTRPAVDSGASIGFLPGTMEDKLGPYLIPLYDELSYFIDHKSLRAWITEHHRIEIVPLSMMRGRTFNNTYVLADEMQNATLGELKMLLTRIGHGSKMVLTGDLRQSDLPASTRGGFARCIDALQDIDDIGICALTGSDIVRHRLIATIEERLSA